MHCEFCGFANGDDDHRCLRCGRRTTGRVVAAPVAYSGNNALAIDPWLLPENQPSLNDTQELPLLRNPAAPSNLIAFPDIQRPAARTPAPAPPPSVSIPPSRPVAPQRKRAAGGRVDQSSLDFTPASVAQRRTLTNGIPASNHCQRPVATVAHRFSASVVDIAMIVLGFALFTGTVQGIGSLAGVPEILGAGHSLLLSLGVFFLVITSFYSIIWLVAQRETAGMRVAGLELVTFGNTPLDAPTRLKRIAATWLSIGAGGLGVIWAIADEEKLTWQDHISESFPTFREREQSFVRQTR
ncbi:MAG: domain containing protein [Bryobacterales bacterium]|nr:domain containing protein [Bryobacterales bacterium]